MWKRLLIAAAIWGALLALPYVLRQEQPPETGMTTAPGNDDSTDRIVIVSAHNKAIKDEYSRAFRKYYRKHYGREVILDFRSPGGTSDIVRYIADRYEAEFRRYYESTGRKWNSEAAAAFANEAVDKDPKASPTAAEARKLFLASDVGIGIDVFAGGGTFDQARHARRGFAVDGKVRERHPEYFDKDIIPPAFGGDRLYDEQGRYYGVVVSTFGILYNTERLRAMADPRPPERWADLGDGKYFNTLTVADPSKSGSANKCFEIVIQQAMADAGSPDAGWENGLNLIKRIFANSRTLTESASKVVREVSLGDAAAGMAIDTYGISESRWSTHIFDGKARCIYVTPRGGTAVGTDPVQILRGAPNRIVAERFVDFLLSVEGQQLHCFVPGVPGGPEHHSLNRPPIRRDLYRPEHRRNFFDPAYDPYTSGADFIYRPQWTGRYYSLLRILLKAIALEAHPELQQAWRAILDAGGPEKVPEAMKYFNALPFTYQQAGKAAASLRITPERDAAAVAATIRQWNEFARKNYLKAAELAREGR